MRIVLSLLILSIITFKICSQNKQNHINPFYYRDLQKNYDSDKIDFSNDFMKFIYDETALENNLTRIIKKYDARNLLTKNSNYLSQNGIIGQNYQRIQIHISKVTKSKVEPNIYSVIGKSKVNQNICDFKGELKILSAFEYKENDSNMPHTGVLFAGYSFYEDTTQSHSGFFKGIMKSNYYLDTVRNLIYLDDTDEIADGYENNTFVGTWTNYKTKIAKKCIWGDYRLPYTFDYDIGDGEMIVNDKYVKNGWESFNNMTDTIYDDSLKSNIEKEKWWLKKTP